jgi:hypothetical protein
MQPWTCWSPHAVIDRCAVVSRPSQENAAGDIVENRPALSRWHPDYTEAFATFMKGGG